MLISFKHKFSFLHIPKTAGKAIREALTRAVGPGGLIFQTWGVHDGVDHAHLLPSQIEERYPLIWKILSSPECLVFSFVRDPLARASSAFGEYQRQFDPNLKEVPTLRDYLIQIGNRRYREPRHGYKFIHGVPQIEFRMDGVWSDPHRFIQLESDDLSEQILSLTSLRIDWTTCPAGQVSRGHAVTPEVRKLLKEVYADDYVTFGYRDP